MDAVNRDRRERRERRYNAVDAVDAVDAVSDVSARMNWGFWASGIDSGRKSV